LAVDLKQLQALFQAVVDLPLDQRDLFLTQRCGTNLEIRRRIEQMLQALEGTLDAPDFDRALPPLSAPGWDILPALDSIHPGELIAGRYKLLQQLGAGAMGVVFVADQTEPVRRRVALKLIREGASGRNYLARFDQECQALALMDHPNIARVYDAGVDKGRPYIAMELVKGLPLTRYCDDAKLSPRQRMELFIPICQAVQHAHQKGIIHRDLKPSNILVGLYDGKPVPKVIDFGIAKATGARITDQSIYTEIGSLVGTLEYMSPEQADPTNLDIDTRSDIYALGVILYELLTGTVPFSRREMAVAGFAEMIRIIKDVKPLKPSTRLSDSGTLQEIAASRQTEPTALPALMRGELDLIVMKALEKDRGRRYETASNFAMDMERYLAGEPVLAVPPTPGYRLRKFIGKHKAPVTAGVLILVVLVIGIFGTTWGYIHATRAQKSAEENFQLANQAVDQFLSVVTDDPMLRQANFQSLRRKLLENAIVFFQKIAGQKRDDAPGKAARGLTYGRLANLIGDLGDNQLALENYQQERAIFAELRAAYPANRDFIQHYWETFNSSGLVLQKLGRPSEAVSAYQQALAGRRQLADAYPTSPEYQDDLAQSFNNLGEFLNETRAAGAEEDFNNAVKIQQQVHDAFPAVAKYAADLASDENNLAKYLLENGKVPQAEAQFRAVLKLEIQLNSQSPADPRYRQDLGNAHDSLGVLLASQNLRSEAESEYRLAFDLRNALVADFPMVLQYREELGTTSNNLATLLTQTGRPEQAAKIFRDAIMAHEQLAAGYPQVTKFAIELGAAYTNFGYFLSSSDARSDPLSVISWFDKAIETLDPINQRFPDLADAKQFLSNSHAGKAQELDKLNQSAKALAEWRAARRLDNGSQAKSIESRLLMSRVSSDQISRDAADCIAAVAEWDATNSTDARALYLSGRFHAICAVVIRQDPKTLAADADRLAGAQASQAVESLKKAVAAGFTSLQIFETDKYLDVLRDRADFKAIIAGLKPAMRPATTRGGA
jgi:serine/threonine protein kinase/tetratricopeptide (TPR) repeat protein